MARSATSIASAVRKHSARAAAVSARIVATARRTSGCSMIGLAALSPVARPCLRPRAKATASWVARSAMPTPCEATLSLAWFIMVNMQASPSLGRPTSQPVAPPSSP